MELLPPTSFAPAVASSKEELKRISVIISKYCGKSKADSFLEACNSYNFSIANAILDDTLKELTGYDSDALSAFADKFSQLSPDLGNKVSSALSDSDKVKAIESYRSEILKIINEML